MSVTFLNTSNFENHTQVFFCQKLPVRSTQMVYHTVSKCSVIKKKLCLPFGGKNSVKTNKCVEVIIMGRKICPQKYTLFSTGACFQESQFNFAFYFIFWQCLTKNYNINYIDFFQPCVDLDEWVQPCSVNYMYHVQDVSCCDEDMEELQNMFFYQVKVNWLKYNYNHYLIIIKSRL